SEYTAVLGHKTAIDDDINVTDPFDPGKPLVYPAFGSLQEFQVDTAFHSAPDRFPGASFNMRSRQGSRRFHGEAEGYYLGEPFQSSNLDDLGVSALHRSRTLSDKAKANW